MLTIARVDQHGRPLPGEAARVPAGLTVWRGVVGIGGFLDGRTLVHATDGRAHFIAYPVPGARLPLVAWACLAPAAGGAARAADVRPWLSGWDLGWLVPGELVSATARVRVEPARQRVRDAVLWR